MNVLNDTADIEDSCNYSNKNNCPLYGKSLTSNIIYEAQITLNQLNYKQKIYLGTAETDFKHRLSNHTKSFNLEHYENDTELSKRILDNKMQSFHTKSHLENNKEMRIFQYNQKKMLSVSQSKAWNRFIQRRQFIEQKVRDY